MNCPPCNQPPMSLVRWLVMLDPMRVQCAHCGTRLTPKPHWRKRYYLISTLAMLMIVAPSILTYFEVIPFQYLMQVFFIAVGLTLLSLFSLAAFFWRRFEYQQDLNQS